MMSKQFNIFLKLAVIILLSFLLTNENSFDQNNIVYAELIETEKIEEEVPEDVTAEILGSIQQIQIEKNFCIQASIIDFVTLLKRIYYHPNQNGTVCNQNLANLDPRYILYQSLKIYS
jgi:hypothetical protein